MAEVRNAYVKARDLDTPVLDARLVARLWQAGRAAHDAAIGEPEGAAGPWAGDAAVADRALLQRAAHVSAGAGQGIHRSVCPVQQDRYAARVGPAELPIGQFGVGQHRRPSPARASAWPPRLRPRARPARPGTDSAPWCSARRAPGRPESPAPAVSDQSFSPAAAVGT